MILSSFDQIGVIGAGAWGTALAATARRAGRDVTLWGREAKVVATIAATGENPGFLPGIALPPGLITTTDPAAATAAAAVLLVVPSQFLRSVCTVLAPHWRPGVPAVICAKGVEMGSLALMTDVVGDILPQAPQAVLSGPTFAAEVARGQPTAVTLACADAALGAALVTALGTSTFRPYLTDDLIGAEIGGAVKNVLAIACGIVEGRGLGDNARAALITRGLAEIIRLAVRMGGRPETLMGLSGLGDLILTASSTQSRNYSLGEALGRGEALADILARRSAVTEGVASAASVVGLAHREGVEMPIAEAVNAILHHGAGLDQAIAALMSRPFRSE